MQQRLPCYVVGVDARVEITDRRSVGGLLEAQQNACSWTGIRTGQSNSEAFKTGGAVSVIVSGVSVNLTPDFASRPSRTVDVYVSGPGADCLN